MGALWTTLVGFPEWTFYGLYSVMGHNDNDQAKSVSSYVVYTDLSTEYNGIHIVVLLDLHPAGLYVATSAELAHRARR